jgi:hypothetical protein
MLSWHSPGATEENHKTLVGICGDLAGIRYGSVSNVVHNVTANISGRY